MKLRVELDISEEEFQALWRRASSRMNDVREDPSKRWSQKEKQEVIRRFVQMIVYNQLVGERD